MAKKEYVKIITPVFRVSFPSVFKPRKAGESGTEKYSVSALFRLKADPSKPDEPALDAAGLAQFEALKKLATDAAIAKWGDDRTKWPTNLQSPFRDGKEKDFDGYGEGIAFCTLSSEYKPGLVDGRNNNAEIIDPKEFYGGCYARAKVHAYAWTYMGKNGVSFSLWHIQKDRDGKPFGGGGDASKEFEALSGAATPPAPAAAAAAGGGFGL